VPPPGSGIILAFILNIMENYNVTKLDANDPLMHHRLVEAFKYGYAYRSQIGDPSDSNITKLVENVSLCGIHNVMLVSLKSAREF
jgi:gamma-glutamyltranspeptidase/glutathione hydrolase/leukotriene-C4 hydrolase